MQTDSSKRRSSQGKKQKQRHDGCNVN